MSRIGINLATRPFRNNAPIWAAFGLAFVLLWAFTWYNVYWFGATGEEIALRSQELQARRSELEALAADTVRMNGEVARVDLQSLNDRSAFANTIILKRLFSWTHLFDRLEEVLPGTVRLRSVRPGISREGIEINVDGMARDYPGLLRFIEALSDSEYFATVYPLQESARESGGEIQFNLTFGYLPSGRTGVAGTVPAAGEAGGEGGSPEGAPAPAEGAGEGGAPVPEDAGAEEETAPEEEGP